MTTFVQCGNCDAENRLGNLFCQKCGKRLDLSSLHAAGSGAGAGGGRATRVLRLVIFCGFLTVLALLCLPLSPAGDSYVPDAARMVPNKMNALRGAAMRGNEVVELFSEAEINAHLNERLLSPVKPEGFALWLREVRLDIKPEETQVWMKCALGPLSLTYSTTTRMTRAFDGRHAFSCGRVFIGRMPMPGPLRDRVLKEIINTFSRLNEELILLNGLPGVEVNDGALQLSTVKQANNPG